MLVATDYAESWTMGWLIKTQHTHIFTPNLAKKHKKEEIWGEKIFSDEVYASSKKKRLREKLFAPSGGDVLIQAANLWI